MAIAIMPQWSSAVVAHGFAAVGRCIHIHSSQSFYGSTPRSFFQLARLPGGARRAATASQSLLRTTTDDDGRRRPSVAILAQAIGCLSWQRFRGLARRGARSEP